MRPITRILDYTLSPFSQYLRLRVFRMFLGFIIAVALVFGINRWYTNVWLDERGEFHPDFAAAAKPGGAIDRGVVPSFLPRSATEIHEFHDGELDKSWVRFDASMADVQALRESWRTTDDPLPPDPRTRYYIKWWLPELTREHRQPHGYRLYLCASEGWRKEWVLAIKPGSNRCYAWWLGPNPP